MIHPGKNKSVDLKHFNKEEKQIIDLISKDWYITNGGFVIRLNENSVYRFFLMKPVNDYNEMFNLEREIVVVFSPYPDFQPRSLDAFEYVFRYYSNLRLETICCVLISKDNNIEIKLGNVTKGDPESRIIIPFTYSDFFSTTNNYFIKNKFRKHFYERDLFAFESPITKDFFFFGRTDLIQKIVNRHKSNENSGLFGLRKTGKTSVIFGVKRALEIDSFKTVIVDCQDTSFNQRAWNKALCYILKELKKQNKIECQIHDEDKYTEENASIIFGTDILKIYNRIGKKPILIIFDEIENISPKTSPGENWKSGKDFVLFWQSIRANFQKFLHQEDLAIFTFLIVGTNPRCIELPTISATDNPIFNKVPFQYIVGFSVEQTKEMVTRLGGYMGLEFDEIIFSKLTEDLGGHPYLMRHVCSIMNELASKTRPTKVDKIIYEQSKIEFSKRYSRYMEMILQVLKEFYPAEYDMLTYLAIEDYPTFKDLADLSLDLIAHLKGYNIIGQNESNYFFKIELVKSYLININKYNQIYNNPEDRWKEISERRNKLEPNLRQIVRMQLQSTFGKTQAFQNVIDVFGGDRKTKCSSLSYNDLFDANSIEIYFNDLIKLISKYYDNSFKNIFGLNKNEIINALEIINKYRFDAHSKNIEKDEMEYFRVNCAKIEKLVNEFI